MSSTSSNQSIPSANRSIPIVPERHIMSAASQQQHEEARRRYLLTKARLGSSEQSSGGRLGSAGGIDSNVLASSHRKDLGDEDVDLLFEYGQQRTGSGSGVDAGEGADDAPEANALYCCHKEMPRHVVRGHHHKDEEAISHTDDDDNDDNENDTASEEDPAGHRHNHRHHPHDRESMSAGLSQGTQRPSADEVDSLNTPSPNNIPFGGLSAFEANSPSAAQQHHHHGTTTHTRPPALPRSGTSSSSSQGSSNKPGAFVLYRVPSPACVELVEGDSGPSTPMRQSESILPSHEESHDGGDSPEVCRPPTASNGHPRSGAGRRATGTSMVTTTTSSSTANYAGPNSTSRLTAQPHSPSPGLQRQSPMPTSLVDDDSSASSFHYLTPGSQDGEVRSANDHAASRFDGVARRLIPSEQRPSSRSVTQPRPASQSQARRSPSNSSLMISDENNKDEEYVIEKKSVPSQRAAAGYYRMVNNDDNDNNNKEREDVHGRGKGTGSRATALPPRRARQEDTESEAPQTPQQQDDNEESLFFHDRVESDDDEEASRAAQQARIQAEDHPTSPSHHTNSPQHPRTDGRRMSLQYLRKAAALPAVGSLRKPKRMPTPVALKRHRTTSSSKKHGSGDRSNSDEPEGYLPPPPTTAGAQPRLPHYNYQSPPSGSRHSRPLSPLELPSPPHPRRPSPTKLADEPTEEPEWRPKSGPTSRPTSVSPKSRGSVHRQRRQNKAGSRGGTNSPSASPTSSPEVSAAREKRRTSLSVSSLHANNSSHGRGAGAGSRSVAAEGDVPSHIRGVTVPGSSSGGGSGATLPASASNSSGSRHRHRAIGGEEEKREEDAGVLTSLRRGSRDAASTTLSASSFVTEELRRMEEKLLQRQKELDRKKKAMAERRRQVEEMNTAALTAAAASLDAAEKQQKQRKENNEEGEEEGDLELVALERSVAGLKGRPGQSKNSPLLRAAEEDSLERRHHHTVSEQDRHHRQPSRAGQDGLTGSQLHRRSKLNDVKPPELEELAELEQPVTLEEQRHHHHHHHQPPPPAVPQQQRKKGQSAPSRKGLYRNIGQSSDDDYLTEADEMVAEPVRSNASGSTSLSSSAPAPRAAKGGERGRAQGGGEALLSRQKKASEAVEADPDLFSSDNEEEVARYQFPRQKAPSSASAASLNSKSSSASKSRKPLGSQLVRHPVSKDAEDDADAALLAELMEESHQRKTRTSDPHAPSKGQGKNQANTHGDNENDNHYDEADDGEMEEEQLLSTGSILYPPAGRKGRRAISPSSDELATSGGSHSHHHQRSSGGGHGARPNQHPQQLTSSQSNSSNSLSNPNVSRKSAVVWSPSSDPDYPRRVDEESDILSEAALPPPSRVETARMGSQQQQQNRRKPRRDVDVDEYVEDVEEAEYERDQEDTDGDDEGHHRQPAPPKGNGQRPRPASAAAASQHQPKDRRRTQRPMTRADSDMSDDEAYEESGYGEGRRCLSSSDSSFLEPRQQQQGRRSTGASGTHSRGSRWDGEDASRRGSHVPSTLSYSHRTTPGGGASFGVSSRNDAPHFQKPKPVEPVVQYTKLQNIVPFEPHHPFQLPPKGGYQRQEVVTNNHNSNNNNNTNGTDNNRRRNNTSSTTKPVAALGRLDVNVNSSSNGQKASSKKPQQKPTSSIYRYSDSDDDMEYLSKPTPPKKRTSSGGPSRRFVKGDPHTSLYFMLPQNARLEKSPYLEPYFGKPKRSKSGHLLVNTQPFVVNPSIDYTLTAGSRKHRDEEDHDSRHASPDRWQTSQDTRAKSSSSSRHSSPTPRHHSKSTAAAGGAPLSKHSNESNNRFFRDESEPMSIHAKPPRATKVRV